MKNPMQFVEAPAKVDMKEAARFLFNPTKAEVDEHKRKAEKSAAAICEAVARLKHEGKW